jgi:hypothetical protein
MITTRHDRKKVTSLLTKANGLPAANRKRPAMLVRMKAASAMSDANIPNIGMAATTARHPAATVVSNSSDSMEN